MYQAKSGQKPPANMAPVLAVFQNVQLGLLAQGVANSGQMPRSLNNKQRKAVAEMVRNINAARRKNL